MRAPRPSRLAPPSPAPPGPRGRRGVKSKERTVTLAGLDPRDCCVYVPRDSSVVTTVFEITDLYGIR